MPDLPTDVERTGPDEFTGEARDQLRAGAAELRRELEDRGEDPPDHDQDVGDRGGEDAPPPEPQPDDPAPPAEPQPA